MHKLILIDGNAILHRAYHALPSLTAPDGQPTQAVFGFFSMLLTILNDQKPEYLIVCFDRPKPTFRQELFAGYHEHRPALANDFVPQIQKVHEIVAKMDISVFELDGYEADDLIGTIAFQTAEKSGTKTQNNAQEVQTLIVSGDRDLLQLVNETTWVLSPLVGLKTLTIYDPQKVEEKFGVKPAQFIDYKALIGDASDGYPGVSGIGPKTAASLIRKFETFEKLYQNLQQVPEKLALKLATDAEQAALAKKLATIITDAPIHIDLEKAAIEKVHIQNAKTAFEELGFNSLLKRLDTLTNAIEEKKKQKEKEKNQQLGLL